MMTEVKEMGAMAEMEVTIENVTMSMGTREFLNYFAFTDVSHVSLYFMSGIG